MAEPVLRLYIAGGSTPSHRAERNLAALAATMSSCPIEIIDVLADPEAADRAGILATPTLVYEHAERPRRIIGDLSDTDRVLAFLGLQPRENPA